MKKLTVLLSIFLILLRIPIYAEEMPEEDPVVLNYNHGYYPECDACECYPPPAGVYPCETCGYNPCECAPQEYAPCPPCAPVAGVQCGISICAIGIALIAVAAAAALIISSGNGSTVHDNISNNN